MEEGGTVADPPVAKPAVASKSEGAVGSETLPTPTQIPDPTLKPEVIKEEDEDAKPAAGGVGSQAQSKKRKLGSIDELRNSTYFKIRSIIRDLRPIFIEVIHAPDFRESKAAHDIRKQMKTMLELTKQLRNEVSVAKPKKSEEQPLPGASKEEKHEKSEKTMCHKIKMVMSQAHQTRQGKMRPRSRTRTQWQLRKISQRRRNLFNSWKKALKGHTLSEGPQWGGISLFIQAATRSIMA